MTDQELRDLLLVSFEYTYEHDDWSNPLDETLAGLTAAQAAWRPDYSYPEPAMGIWDIVLHLAVWNDDIVQRIQTGEKSRPAEGAWPARSEILSEDEWEAAKARLWASITRLRELIETVDMDKIRSSPYGLPDLTCRFTHLAYHIGQIVKIRECNGW